MGRSLLGAGGGRPLGHGRAGQGLGWGDGRGVMETLCHRGMGTAGLGPSPKAQCRAQQPLRGRTGGALDAGSTSQPTLAPTVLPPSPRAELWPLGLRAGQITKD